MAALNLLISITLVSYAYFGYIHVFHNLSVGAIVITMLAPYVFFQTLKNNQGINKQLIVLSFALFFIYTIDIYLNNKFYFNQNYITPPLFFFVFYHVAKYQTLNHQHLKFFLLLICISVFIAMLQTLNIEFAWQLRQILPQAQDSIIDAQITSRLKAPGLAYYSVQLSYQLYCAAVFALALAEYSIKKTEKYFYTTLVVFLMGCAAFIQTLSAFLGTFILLLLYFYGLYANPLKNNLKKTFLILSNLLILALIFNSYIVPQMDSTKLSRITFLIIGLKTMTNNPLGVADTDITDVKTNVVANSLSSDLPMAESIFETSFHNTFLNIGVKTGWLGLAIYIGFYLYLLFYYRHKSRRGTSLLEKKLGYVGYIGSIGYLAQCLTHNSGPFTSDPYFWILNGYLIGYISKAVSINRYSNKEKPLIDCKPTQVTE